MESSATRAELLQAIRLGGPVPAHIAVIMDGNGRWARSRGLPRFRGHAAGMTSVRDVIEGAIEAGVQVLTLFTFSQENWDRPAAEVAALMKLLQRYVVKERVELKRQGVRVRVFGELDRMPAAPRRAVEQIQQHTADGTRLDLNLMLSYGARAEIVRAARRLADQVASGRLLPAEIDEARFAAELYTAEVPDPDLLIRTSGEQRISNFMLWQVAYTELHITPVYWPDFRREHLFAAIQDYQGRERRFGRVSAS
ncbi:MAG TPA: isoprenyl transferase [Longimicrobiales bacterium]|nr:isoprenyl transferase [Longimicrobiales bacterium]